MLGLPATGIVVTVEVAEKAADETPNKKSGGIMAYVRLFNMCEVPSHR